MLIQVKNHTSIVSENSVSVKRGMDESGVIYGIRGYLLARGSDNWMIWTEHLEIMGHCVS